MFRHADGYRGKRVVVVGVGNTACDAAVDLSEVCSQVKVLNNRSRIYLCLSSSLASTD